jgi:predicted dehydrogenase
MTNPCLSVAVVGCGKWGRNLVRNYHELGVLTAVHDSNEELAKHFAKQYNVESLSFADILENPNIDAVVIAVPSAAHYHLARNALIAGKHAFVEKPLAMSLPESQDLLDLAKTHNATLMTGHLLQFHPSFMAIREELAKGVIGNILHIQSNRMNVSRMRVNEDCIWDLAPHDISMILSITKDMLPIDVKCETFKGFSRDIVDTATIFLRFEDGVKAQICLSHLHAPKEHRMVVTGDKGILVFDDVQPWSKKLALYRYQARSEDAAIQMTSSEPVYYNLKEEEPLKLECQHFIECIQKGYVPRTDIHEAFRVMQVLQQVTDAKVISNQHIYSKKSDTLMKKSANS